MIHLDKLNWMRQRFIELAEPSPEWRSYVNREQLNIRQLASNHITLGICLCRCFEYLSGNPGFEFHPSGVACAVVDAICYRREDALIEPYTADLIAWPLSDPFSFATACGPGDGCELLGALAAVDRGGQPLRLYQTPLEWLQADCQGSVPLKTGAGYWLRKAGGPFIVDDADHAAEMQALLGGDAHLQRFLVARNEIRRAA